MHAAGVKAVQDARPADRCAFPPSCFLTRAAMAKVHAASCRRLHHRARHRYSRSRMPARRQAMRRQIDAAERIDAQPPAHPRLRQRPEQQRRRLQRPRQLQDHRAVGEGGLQHDHHVDVGGGQSSAMRASIASPSMIRSRRADHGVRLREHSGIALAPSNLIAPGRGQMSCRAMGAKPMRMSVVFISQPPSKSPPILQWVADFSASRQQLAVLAGNHNGSNVQASRKYSVRLRVQRLPLPNALAVKNPLCSLSLCGQYMFTPDSASSSAARSCLQSRI